MNEIDKKKDFFFNQLMLIISKFKDFQLGSMWNCYCRQMSLFEMNIFHILAPGNGVSSLGSCSTIKTSDRRMETKCSVVFDISNQDRKVNTHQLEYSVNPPTCVQTTNAKSELHGRNCRTWFHYCNTCSVGELLLDCKGFCLIYRLFYARIEVFAQAVNFISYLLIQ